MTVFLANITQRSLAVLRISLGRRQTRLNRPLKRIIRCRTRHFLLSLPEYILDKGIFARSDEIVTVCN